MQLCNIQNWTSENGFKFSISKMVCIHFHQQYGFFLDPNILRGKMPIKAVKEAKFLGLIFDTTFKNHVQHLKSSCQKTLDILRHTGWGVDRTVLLRLYHALVCSKLDYECIVYGLAHQSVLKQLDPIHHQGLHIALGSLCTSPTQSLYMEAHELFLVSFSLKLSLNYTLKLKSLLENPAYSCFFEPQNIRLCEESESKIPPLGIHILP